MLTGRCGTLSRFHCKAFIFEQKSKDTCLIFTQSGSKETRQVQQFHFLVWPDKGVPRHATAVLGLRTKVRAKHKDCKSPLVVHCR